METGLPNAIQQIYVDTESCPYGTKCYVDEGSVGAVRCLGWDINVDRKGYFYETTSERQKIVGVRTSCQQLDELRGKLVSVENAAIAIQALFGNPDFYKMNNTTLGYVRSFNSNYVMGGEATSFAWLLAAGQVDPTINSILDQIGSNEYYFSQFVSNQSFCAPYHHSNQNPRAGERSTDTEFALFTDPITNSKEIDLIHMFASLDGSYNWTLYDSASGQTLSYLFPALVHDLVSWGGDLQTAANAIQSAINSNSLSIQEVQEWMFQDVMDGNYGCSESDILADFDALNITGGHLYGPGRASDALADYYGATFSNHARAQSFITSVNRDLNNSWEGSAYKKFVLEVHDVLGLKAQGNDWVTSDEYYNNELMSQVKFSIAKRNGVDPSADVRKAVADKFCQYVFSLC